MLELSLENNDLEKTKELNQDLGNDLYNMQKSFMQSTVGKIINGALDIGLKAALPDLIENEVIDIKDVILENGLKEGIKEVVNSAIDFGKSAAGIVTGNFESVEQVQIAVKSGGILDKTSELLDYAINLASKRDLISKTTSSIIKQSKNSIISSISNKIEESLINQIKAVEKIEKYCKNWNMAYGIQDFEKMEKAYKNIKNNLEKIIPLEKIINSARTIENIHNRIKNTGDFNITENEILVAQKLA